jgi:hypothetical protein
VLLGSLRDIEVCLAAQASKLYHMGISQRIARSTLADANERRDWRIYAEFAQRLIARARTLYAADSFGVELNHTVYALDATTIDLCLSVFPWAPFRSTKAAVKTARAARSEGRNSQLYSHPRWQAVRGEGPRYADSRARRFLCDGPRISGLRASVHTRSSRQLFRHSRQAQHGRTACVLGFHGSQHRSDLRSTDRAERVLCDPTLPGAFAPHPVSRSGHRKEFGVPDQSRLAAAADNLRALQEPLADRVVLLFFKWIKQHLRIKRFYGTSENTVKTQICTAVAVYVLVAIIKKELNLKASLHTLLQILSVTLFEKLSLHQTLAELEDDSMATTSPNQLTLFGS